MNEKSEEQPTNHDVAETAPPAHVADFSDFEKFVDEGNISQAQMAMNADYETDRPARLVKHQTVLELQLDGTNESFALYTHEDCQEAFSLDSIQYEDMGRPSKITVTVRPGDHLNK